MTPTVWEKVSRYRSSEPESAASRNQAPSRSTSVSGRWGVPAVAGEFDDGSGAQAAVEVVVQQNLGRPADLVRIRDVTGRVVLVRHFRTIPPTRVERLSDDRVDT
jgi:hypothetical protein